jgi:hypothetical protein
VTKPGKPLLKLHLPELLAAIAKSRPARRSSTNSARLPSEKIDISCEPRSGSTFPFGLSSIKCFASDDLGNRDEGAIDVNVWDGTAPSLTIPKSLKFRRTTRSAHT